MHMTKPGSKNTLAELIDRYIERVLAIKAKKCKKCPSASSLVETGTGTLPSFRYQTKPHRTETG